MSRLTRITRYPSSPRARTDRVPMQSNSAARPMMTGLEPRIRMLWMSMRLGIYSCSRARARRPVRGRTSRRMEAGRGVNICVSVVTREPQQRWCWHGGCSPRNLSLAAPPPSAKTLTNFVPLI